MRSEEETRAAMDRHGDMVRRLCLVHLKNQADTEDVFQTVFLRYVLSPQVFTSEEHEKAWLIRVTVNACRDLLRSWARSRRASLEEALELAAPPDQESREVLAAVLSLPEKYRDVNIGNFRLSRPVKGGEAVMTIEIDGMPPKGMIEDMRQIKDVTNVILIRAI